MNENFLRQNRGRNIFIALAFLIVTFSGLYVYFVSQATLNVVEWKNLQSEVATLHLSLSNLESEYLREKNNIDIGYAHKLGFMDVSEVKYVIKSKSLGKVLSFNNEI